MGDFIDMYVIFCVWMLGWRLETGLKFTIQTKLSGDWCAGGCSFGVCAFAREQAQGCEVR